MLNQTMQTKAKSNMIPEYDSEEEFEYDSDFSSENTPLDYEEYRRNMKSFITFYKKQNTKSIFKSISEGTLEPLNSRYIYLNKKEKENTKYPLSPSPPIKTEIKVEKTTSSINWKINTNAKNNIINSLIDIIQDVSTEGEWTTVAHKPKKSAEEKFATKQMTQDEIRKANIGTQMCKSVKEGIPCSYTAQGKKCNFAHDPSELKVPYCRFQPCRNVKQVSRTKYENIGSRICGCKHSNEGDDEFYTRTTGIEKRATEEEMQQALYEFINSTESCTSASNTVKAKEQPQKWVSPWAATFDGFLKTSLQQLQYIARINGVQSHYFLETKNNHSKTRPKTRNMLLLDISKFIVKQYPQRAEDVEAFINKVKSDEKDSKDSLNKPSLKVFRPADINKEWIIIKNKLSLDIKSAKAAITHSKETINRLTSRNMTIFEKKQVERISNSITDKLAALKDMENQLVKFQDIKAFEAYFTELNNAVVNNTNKVEDVAKVVVSKKPLKKVESEFTIIIISNTKAPKTVVVEEEGWTDIVHKERAKKVEKKTCNSVFSGEVCRHGVNCRFSHDKVVNIQPVQPKRTCNSVFSGEVCRHGANCRFSHDKSNVIVKDVIKPSVPVPTVSKINKALTKTQMCKSVKEGTSCTHGINCRFAHNKSELVKIDCRFGNSCYHVRVGSSGRYSNNLSSSRVCTYIHPCETEENYENRTA